MPVPMIASPARYSLFCALVLGGLWFLAREGAALGLLSALLLLPLVAWPAWIALALPATVRRIDARSSLRDGKVPLWAPLLGGALWKQIAAVPVATAAAAGMGWTLVGEGTASLLGIAAVALVLWPVARSIAGGTGALRPYARLRPVLILAPPMTAALVTLGGAAILGLGAATGGTLAERVAAAPRYEGASALLAWAVDGLAIASGARAWAEGELGPLGALWRLAGAFGQAWLVALAFAGGLVPAGEANRILRPTDGDVPPPVGPGRAAFAGFLVTVLGGALVTAAAEAEAWAAARAHPVTWAGIDGMLSPAGAADSPNLDLAADPAPPLAGPALLTPSAIREVVEAERIGELACAPGTIAAVEAIDRSFHDVLALRRAEVERAARAGFDAVRARVPVFLDGYYSLTAEYVRTFHLLAADAEAFLQAEMTEALAIEEGFAPFRAAVAALEAPLPPGALAERDWLLAVCGFLPSDGVMLSVVATAPAGLLIPAPDAETIGLRARLGAAGVGTVAGGLAGAVGGKIIGKLVAKEAFELAAGAVAKLAVAKAAGGLGGAAAGAGAGAVAGSVVPGIGTTVGAAIGGVIGGLAIGVAADYAMIRIEEAVSRDDFERQILASIDEAEAEWLATLFPPDGTN